jgi:hypothetical protein
LIRWISQASLVLSLRTSRSTQSAGSATGKEIILLAVDVEIFVDIVEELEDA